nr:transposase [Ciceribacter ferrooxidans]
MALFGDAGWTRTYFGLNPRVRQPGLGAAHRGRISKVRRSHARATLVEAAWAAARAPGPLHAFFVRIRAKRGRQIAAVALACKFTVLCWHLLTREQDYLWARPDLAANKTCTMELQAGLPQKKGNRRVRPQSRLGRKTATTSGDRIKLEYFSRRSVIWLVTPPNRASCRLKSRLA